MSFAGHVLDMIKRMEANRSLQRKPHKHFEQKQEFVDAEFEKEKYSLNKKLKMPDGDAIKKIETNARRRQAIHNLRFALLLIFVFLISVFLFFLFVKN